MIKECEIKVENRGMADAQGWELIISPIQNSARSKKNFEILLLIAWEAGTAESDASKW